MALNGEKGRKKNENLKLKREKRNSKM